MTDPIDRRTFLATSGTAVAAACAGCAGDQVSQGGGEDQEPYTDPVTVEVGLPDDSVHFDPQEVSVVLDTTVRFVWATDDHTILPQRTPDQSDWEGVQEPHDEGHEYEFAPSVSGTYRFACGQHEGTGGPGEINAVDSG